MGSRDRRNDRFDRSWIFARCFAIVPSPVPSRPVPSPSSFFLYIDVRIPCRLFLSSRMGLYDVPSHCRTALPPSSCDRRPAIPARRSDFISGRTRGTTTPSPARTFSTTELYSPGSLTSADSRGYKFSLGNACSARVLNLFVPTPRILGGEVAE